MKKYTFLTCLALLCTPTFASATDFGDELPSSGAAAAKSELSDEELAKIANWTKTFQTRIGPVLHTPERVIWGLMTCGSLHLESRFVNEVELKAPLILKSKSSREEFLEGLRTAGVID